jgi:plasmid replication initiation protein
MIDEYAIIEKSRNVVMMQCLNLNERELKILDIYLSRIDPRDTSTREVTFTKSEFEELLGIDRIRTEKLKLCTKHLIENTVYIELPDGGYDFYNLFSSAKTRVEKRSENDKVGQVIIKLNINQELDPVFFNIKNLGYIRYRLKYVIELKYKYDIKLYLLFKLHEYNKPYIFKISFSELKKEIECTKKSYNEYKAFNQFVLKPSVQRINDFTDINVTYRKSRKDEDILFTISRKTKDKLKAMKKKNELEKLEQKAKEEPQQTEQPTEEPVKESVELDNKYNIPLDVLQDEDYDLDLLETKVRQAIPSADENKMQEIFQVVNIKYNPQKAQAPFLYYLGILKKTLIERTELGKQDKIEKAKKNAFHNFDERDYDYDSLLHELNGLG